MPSDALRHYLERLAAFFGFRPGANAAEVDLERRAFIFSLVAAGVIASTPSGLLVPTEPKIHAVPQTYRRARRRRRPGLRPVPGSPGCFHDAETGQIVNIRDFRESDKYDSILVPAKDLSPGALFTFFRDTERESPEAIAEVVRHPDRVVVLRIGEALAKTSVML